MPWFRVDDRFAMHPKVIAAGNTAIGLWVRAGSWSAQLLTDGQVPRGPLAALGGKPRDAQSLVDAGLWTVTETGWSFHDWDGFQPSRAEVEQLRATRSQAGRKGGKASGSTRRGHLEDVNDT